MSEKIQQEPQISENVYYRLFNLIDEPIQICELVFDERGKPIDNIILDVNPAYERHSGLRREQVIGKHIKEILPIIEQIWLERYAEVIRSCKETHFEEYNASLKKWFEVTASSMGGNRFIVVFKDITERKKTEEGIAKQARLLNLSYDAILIRDSNDQISYWNLGAEMMYGYTKEEALGRLSHELLKTEFSQPREEIFKILYRDNRWTGKLIHTRKDGIKITVDTRWVLDRDTQGNLTSILEANNDITHRKHLEEQIRQRAEELEMVMDVAPVAIWIGHDPLCHNITGNHLANKFYEAEFGENVSANITLLRHFFHKGRELTADELPMQQAALKDVDVRDVEFDVLLPSGKWRALMGSASPLHNLDGSVRGSVGTFFDITERKKTEESLKNSFDHLEVKVKERTEELEKAYYLLKEKEGLLSDSQKIAHIGSWEWDLETNLLHWSEETYRIFGRNPQEFDLNYYSFFSFVHPEDRTDVYLATKKALNEESYEIEYRIVLPDGEERIVYSQSGIIFDEKKKSTLMRGTIQDITERKRAEERLFESEEKYRNIVETANEGIVVVNAELKITYWNKKIEEMFGYVHDEYIGMSIWEFFSEDSKSIAKTIVNERYKDVNQSFEIKLKRKDGSYMWAHTNARFLTDKNDKFIGIMAMLTDVSERKKVEEDLAKYESNRKKEVHHRIKNNLQVISSLLDLQADKFKSKTSVKVSKVLDAFRESQDRIISMALIHEELHNGGDNDTINISQYIEELTDNLFLTYRLGNENTRLCNVIEEDISFNMDTSVPLGLLINELLSNSFKYAFVDRDNGEIQIKFHREENGDCIKEDCNRTAYVLSVSDNGVGIPENLDIEELDSLGLQLVTTLVDQLDGELELKGDNGTEFIIRFSVEEENKASVPITEQSVSEIRLNS